jgi:hypothetical protein
MTMNSVSTEAENTMRLRSLSRKRSGWMRHCASGLRRSRRAFLSTNRLNTEPMVASASSGRRTGSEWSHEACKTIPVAAPVVRREMRLAKTKIAHPASNSRTGSEPRAME